MDEQEASNLELDLKLNLLPPLTRFDQSSSAESSSPCGWSEAEADGDGGGGEEAKSMVVVGCPNCLMYIITSLQGKPRCPRCKNNVLIDFLGGNNVKNNTIKKRSNK